MNISSIKTLIKKKELELAKTAIAGNIEFFKDKFATFNDKPIVTFKLRNYQKRDLIAFKSHIQPKMFLHYPRRSGKDVFSFCIMVDYALENVGNYAYILPDREQASKVIWRGVIINRDNELEHPEITRFLEIIPKSLIASTNNQEKVITLTNGSVIYLAGATRADSLRGINLRGVVFSEFAFYRSHEVYQVLQPVITQSKSWVIINTTPNSYDFSWRLFNSLKHDDRWITRLETVETLKDDENVRYISDEDVENCRVDGNMTIDSIKREFYCEPYLNSETLYYAHEMKSIDDDGRIQDVNIIHNLPIHYAFDLGSDATPIIGFQVEITGTIRVVFYHTPTTEVYTYGWYYSLIKEFTMKNNAIMGRCILPHDSVKRQVGETHITTAKDSFRDAGADVVVLRRSSNKDALINLSKVYLSKVIIDKKATHLIDSLSAYCRDYNERDKVFGKKPLHNWACHAADCWQYVSQSIEDGHLASTRRSMSYKRGTV